MTGQILLGLLGILSTFLLSGLALWRTIKQDRRNAAAQNLEEVFDASSKVIKNISDDNDDLRQRLRTLEGDMAAMQQTFQAKIDELTTERNQISHKYLKVQRENVVLKQQLEGVA